MDYQDFAGRAKQKEKSEEGKEMNQPEFLKEYEGKHQYVLKNMQEMCLDVFVLTKKFYASYDEAVADTEDEGLFRVWCRFENPGFIKRENRKTSFCTTFPRG